MDTSAIYNIGYGLYLLTTKSGGKDNGCIINTTMQITSNEPMKLLISVNKSNATHDMIMSSKEFNVSILTKEVPFSIFERFGFQSGRDVDKFEGMADIKRAENGILYLDKYTNAYLSLKVVDTIDCDTHTIFLSELTDAKNLSSDESVTYAYYHKNIKPQPDKKTTGGWRCKICGYIYEGDILPDDFTCPICKHGASDFEKIE